MNQSSCITTVKIVSGYILCSSCFRILLIIETEGGVVDLLEPPVSEEATPLPSSHDVLVQSVRLQKALNRLGLVTQQVEVLMIFILCVEH